VTEELVRTLVTAGGYTHPLFATAAPTTPLPGQAVLLLMGGLVEQSGLLDDAVALLELGPARFHAMVRAGDRLSILVEEAGSRSTADGRLVSTYRWAVVDQAGSTVAETRAVMLRRAPEDLPEEASA
jgi:acyl dehydratase